MFYSCCLLYARSLTRQIRGHSRGFPTIERAALRGFQPLKTYTARRQGDSLTVDESESHRTSN